MTIGSTGRILAKARQETSCGVSYASSPAVDRGEAAIPRRIVNGRHHLVGDPACRVKNQSAQDLPRGER